MSTNRFEGGRGLATGTLSADLDAIKAAAAGPTENGIVSGLTGSDPSTPNDQQAGTGNTTWKVNVAAGIVIVDSVEKAEGAQADFAIHSGSMLVAASQDCYCRIVEKNAAGTLSTVAVKGSAAAAGEAVVPTDAEVDLAVSGVEWVELFRIKLSRDATTNLTEVYDHSHRGVQGALDLANVTYGSVAP